jgi:hypothetical protein
MIAARKIPVRGNTCSLRIYFESIESEARFLPILPSLEGGISQGKIGNAQPRSAMLAKSGWWACTIGTRKIF